MPRGPKNLRPLSALVAGAFAISGCVTTYVVPPARLIPVAGLPEDQEAELQTTEGLETVTGSTRVTLRSTEGTPALWTPNQNSGDGGPKTATEVPLSSPRRESGAALFGPNQNSRDGGSKTATEVPLSSLRSEGEMLVLSETGQTLALNNIWSAEVTKPSPSKTAGLVAVIIVGTALATFFVAFVVAASTF